ncbi:MAG: protein phosphatase 2C domain-containing protein [Oscillospiraceae bacterium]|nr:protein phosphatase 2C domain-containing protein [Oscillospiraceae bacterium]
MSVKEKKTPDEKQQLSDAEVTSHTASLWKYNPIPESPEPYPEYLTAYDKKSSSEIIAARVRGKKHKHEGSNCDDWYAFDRAGDWTIAVVSDGAGSKALSRIGAKASCDAVVSSLKTEFTAVTEMCPDIKADLSKAYDDPAFNAACGRLAVLMQNSFGAAFSAVENAYITRAAKSEFEESMGRKPEISDYSGTLLAAVIIPVERGEHFIISVQIGDGMIASVNFNADFENALRLLGNADGGSFAGETEFLTSEQMRNADSLKSRTKILRGKISSVMLMSDGVADDYYPNNPQLLRLYLDLMTNGIIGLPQSAGKECSLKIPSPVAYPWVNDSDVSYSLQYVKNILSENSIELSALWKERSSGVLKKAALESFDISNGSEKTDRLMVWLDNYVERGSFDDRTLVIINV